MAIIKLNDNYYESIDSESPETFVFNSDGPSTATMTFVVSGKQILQFVQDVLGYAVLFANSYVKRPSIAASHPLFPFLWASKIQQIKGYNPVGKSRNDVLITTTTYKDIDVKFPEYVGVYDLYKIVVLFESREYLILTDEDVFKHSLPEQKLYLPYLNALDDFEVRTYNYTQRAEYTRYFNITQTPNLQFLNFGNGNYFMKGGINETWADKPLPQNQTGSNNIMYSTYSVIWNWYFVPYEIAFNNWYWTHAYSTINQYDFAVGINPYNVKPFMAYEAGQLLFKKIEVKKYEPTYPFNLVNITPTSGIPDYYAQYNRNIYCDIKFFLEYRNYLTDKYVIPDANSYVSLPCKNVKSPHNLIPHPATMVSYYVETLPKVLKKSAKPIYWSFPHQSVFNYSQTEPPLA